MSHSREQVVAALRRHRGSVKDTAEDLGISRQAIYRAIDTMKIGAEEWGGQAGQSGQTGQSGLSQNRNVRMRGDEALPTFPTVSTTMEAPRKLTHRTIAVSPEHFEMLREAKWDLQASLRKDFSEATVLGLFIAEAFEGWLQGRKEDK